MREGAACPRTPASDITRAGMPSALSTSASDCAEGRSGRVLSRRHSVSLIVRYSAIGAMFLQMHCSLGPRRIRSVLSIRQLARSFREGERVHHVLSGADAQIDSGETVAIMGR